ncbi:MAG TPA: hypothetical protein VIO64_17720 [Pseudobacteroides sp.]|uniref:hypothetical protein n=1 Tax=Pseudobacteroides sp. TaxID=1968840 RepID=UPI002F9525D7
MVMIFGSEPQGHTYQLSVMLGIMPGGGRTQKVHIVLQSFYKLVQMANTYKVYKV